MIDIKKLINLVKKAGRSLRIHTKTKLTGTLKAELHYVNGDVVPVFNEKNVIVLTAKQSLLSYLYTANLTSDPINVIQVGIGGSIDPQGLYPKPVSQNMTQLYNSVASIPTTYSIDSAVPSVTYIADVDAGTANGDLITEAGLFKTSGLMFNIKTFPAITKTSEFSIHFEWTIDIA